MIWRCNPICELYKWNDDAKSYFVLNALSGQTHLLSQLATDTLELLRHQTVDEKVVFNQLASLYEDFDPEDAETHQHAINMLASLDELGLIEPFSCSM